MSRRSKIIIAVLVVLALLLLGLWWWLSHLPAGAPSGPPPGPSANAAPAGGLITNQPSGSATNVSYPSPATNAPAPKPAEKPSTMAAARTLAMWFSERYGSFSVQGDYANITDLEPVMTAAMAAREQAYVDAQRAQPRTEGQRGTVTVALNATADSFDEAAGTADFTVKTQRTEYVGISVKGSTTYQDIKIGMLKEDGTWKVNSAQWQ